MNHFHVLIGIAHHERWLRAPALAAKAWVSLGCFCSGEENGGLIAECSAWGDSEWMNRVGIHRQTVDAVVAAKMAHWVTKKPGAKPCLQVVLYDTADEARCLAGHAQRRAAAQKSVAARRARRDRMNSVTPATAPTAVDPDAEMVVVLGVDPT